MLSFTRQGNQEGPALVFMHYLGGSAKTWCPVIEGLKNDYDCIAFDMPGFGDSEYLKDMSIQSQAEALWENIESLNIKRPFLIGHSMSGKIASVMSLQFPERISGLVLVAPSPLTPQPMTVQQYLQQKDWTGSAEEAKAFVNGSCSRPLKPAFEKLAIDDTLRADFEAFHKWANSGSQEDFEDVFDKVKLPVKLIIGNDDRSVPNITEQIKRTLVYFNPYSFKVMDNCGHLLPLECPNELSEEIGDFVSLFYR
ncbi:alpha/beta hydrolase [Pantoea ananatis]|uniref:alpha/beta fold hydrolase n=1 Tax=Pantoea ananas TaxID=553 RepID=UPI002221CBE4|nr:alpha/beta hydrolase [Pantoea ananatis]MCW1834587.1 alpha/beta hydrolase [Pantoea ananatis]